MKTCRLSHFGYLIIFSFLTGSLTQAQEASTQLQVQLSSSQECQNQETIAWLSAGRTLLYQATVSPVGDFEFHLLPGNYNLVLTSKEGCFAEKTLNIKAGQVAKMSLTLNKAKKITQNETKGSGASQ